MIGKLKDLLRTAGGEWVVSFTTKADPREIFDTFQDNEVSIDIRKASKHRSKTANDFCWAMCSDIAKAIRPPITKEEVYRRAIKDVGKFETLHIREDAVEAFRSIWYERGVGWFTEVVDYSAAPGCKVVFAYFGSSTYNTEEMSRLIDYLKQDMVNMGLPIPVSKEEEERMMAQWQRAYSRREKGATSAEKSTDSKNTTSSEESQTGNSQRSTA